MSHPRVLCVSRDRSTRAALTLALTDAPVRVSVVADPAAADDRLERERVDAVVIDAETISNVPAVARRLESRAPSPAPSTFAYWSGDESGAESDGPGREADEGETGDVTRTPTLAELTTSRSPADSRAALAGTILDRVETSAAATRRFDLVETVRHDLADATSPHAVERVIREAFTASDAFEFAWVGEYDRGERSVVPWATDPDATAWPIHRTFRVGNGANPLLERALYAQTLQTHELEPGFESAPESKPDAAAPVPFRERAREHGVRTVAVAPLATPEERYGVLVAYAPTTLSDADRETIRSVADVASHVLDTIAIRGRLEQQERTLHRYERLVETAGDGIFVLDASGHVMTVNDALVEMTGYTREWLLGEHVSLLFDEAIVERARTTVRDLVRADGRSTTIEVPLETKAGEYVPCEAQIAVLDRDGEFDGAVGVLRDVTERKRNERRLREQNERLDAFARIVSHDLRNPLGIAQGYLDLVSETGSLEHLPTARNSLDRMETIIDDVLAIARDGTWASETERLDLEAVATEAWEHVSTGEAVLSVLETTELTADSSRLLRVFENLFRNAIEHGLGGAGAGGEGGDELTVRVGALEYAESSLASADDADEAQPDEPCGFFVADDGRGLPDDLCANDDLFDPSTSAETDGLGIGLWIVREVAAGHGWRVTARESESGGARFEFVTVDE